MKTKLQKDGLDSGTGSSDAPDLNVRRINCQACMKPIMPAQLLVMERQQEVPYAGGLGSQAEVAAAVAMMTPMAVTTIVPVQRCSERRESSGVSVHSQSIQQNTFRRETRLEECVPLLFFSGRK
jgi:hypothetical protein